MLKYCDIHVKVGTASPCVGMGMYAFVFCVIISPEPLQTVDMELVLLDTARTCKRLGMNPRQVCIMPMS